MMTKPASALLVLAALAAAPVFAAEAPAPAPAPERIVLVKPDLAGGMTLNQALATRRSVRTFDTARALTPAELSQLLWAMAGVTDPAHGKRTAPSAHAIYPLDVYVVLANGFFRYDPKTHAIERVAAGDLHRDLAAAAMNQAAVAEAPAVFVIAADMKRAAEKFKDRAVQFLAVEAGHVAQNLLLEATGLGLAGVPVGGYDPAKVPVALKLGPNDQVFYLLPVGKPR